MVGRRVRFGEIHFCENELIFNVAKFAPKALGGPGCRHNISSMKKLITKLRFNFKFSTSPFVSP